MKSNKKIIIIGSVNCAPTEYAIILKERFNNIKHYYEPLKNSTLYSPLQHYGAASKKLLAGIELHEVKFKHPFFYVFGNFFKRKLIREINKSDVVFLSGASIGLARFLNNNITIFSLTYGHDITLYCNKRWPKIAFENSTRIYPIKVLIKKFHEILVKSQIKGLQRSNYYTYFIEGFDPIGDEILKSFLDDRINYRLPMFSVSTKLLNVLSNFYECEKNSKLIHRQGELTVVFPVRFNSGDKYYGDKGWKMLFDGIKIYHQARSTVLLKCICFKKGDYKQSQDYAVSLGIEGLFEWRDQINFLELTSLFMHADVVIEQLGSAWIGQGFSVMALGKPLISRLSQDAQKKFFEGSGILDVQTPSELSAELEKCESIYFRERTGMLSKEFVYSRYTKEKEVFETWDIENLLNKDLLST